MKSMGSRIVAEQYDFDWADLAFASKKPLKELQAIFIAAPREISSKRFVALIKDHLPKRNIILGIAKEDYVNGFEGQPQFKMLQQKVVQSTIDKANASTNSHKIYTLHYFQRELVPIIEKLHVREAIFVNGSWQYVFHASQVYYSLVNLKIPYSLVAAFVDEPEARAYSAAVKKQFSKDLSCRLGSEAELLSLATAAAQRSFDYSFQTGAVLAKKRGRKYTALIATHNKVVPYETYALLEGASREKNFSPAQDMNHYDAVHAEVSVLIEALQEKIDLNNTTLFINLLPCPTCARMLASTNIAEVVYQNDHSDGYAVKLLENAGKKVRRIVF